MDYITRADELWTKYVPETGQADTLQGELLREIEALRIEAQEHDNLNFDGDYAYFCDFIWQSLEQSGCISRRKLRKISQALATIKRYGLIAADYNRGAISKRQFVALHKGNPSFSYPGDDLYDMVLKGIVEFCECQKEPVPHRINPTICR